MTESASTSADCGKDSGALGAHGHAKGTVFHVATGENLSSLGANRGTHSEA